MGERTDDHEGEVLEKARATGGRGAREGITNKSAAKAKRRSGADIESSEGKQ